jgi:hypothetical protein
MAGWWQLDLLHHAGTTTGAAEPTRVVAHEDVVGALIEDVLLRARVPVCCKISRVRQALLRPQVPRGKTCTVSREVVFVVCTYIHTYIHGYAREHSAEEKDTHVGCFYAEFPRAQMWPHWIPWILS